LFTAENTSDVKVALCSAERGPVNPPSAEIQDGGKLTAWYIRSLKREEKETMPLPEISLIRKDG
jgi:hypothetical protein